MTKSNNDTIGAEPQAWVPAFHHWPRSRCLHLPENTQRYFGQIHLNTEGEKKKKKRKKNTVNVTAVGLNYTETLFKQRDTFKKN